jgi:hypothetical protein
MCAWDAKKHKVIASKKVKDDDGHVVIVEIFSYDKGAEKVGLRSEIEKKAGDPIVIPFKSATPEHMLKIARATVKLCKTHLGIE